MNGIDPITQEQKDADDLLTFWGKWVRSRAESLGYSRECIESRLMREGVLIPTVGKLEETNIIAEELERIIVLMPYKMKKLVKIEYLTYTTRKIKQKRLHLSEYSYTKTLRDAQDRVSREFNLKKSHVRAKLISVG